jgi:hypothetical protein
VEWRRLRRPGWGLSLTLDEMVPRRQLRAIVPQGYAEYADDFYPKGKDQVRGQVALEHC